MPRSNQTKQLLAQSLQELMEGCPVAPFVPLAHQTMRMRLHHP